MAPPSIMESARLAQRTVARASAAELAPKLAVALTGYETAHVLRHHHLAQERRDRHVVLDARARTRQQAVALIAFALVPLPGLLALHMTILSGGRTFKRSPGVGAASMAGRCPCLPTLSAAQAVIASLSYDDGNKAGAA